MILYVKNLNDELKMTNSMVDILILWKKSNIFSEIIISCLLKFKTRIY